MPRFDRTYQLTVGKPGQMGDLIQPPIHITFDITKTAQESPNLGNVRIWNLAQATRRAYEQPDLVCLLQAGYAQEDGALMLASGNVVDAWTRKDGGDVITELQLADGYVPIRDTAVTLSYGAGASSDAIIRDIAKQMGLPLVMADVPRRTWAHGFAFFGSAHEALHKIVRGTGLEWSIQDGRLQIVPTGGTTVKVGYMLNAQSGMIGSPERLRKGAQEQVRVKDRRTGDNKDVTSTRQAVNGWRVQSLLLPTVVPGDRVRIESESATGWFRVETIRHSGDWGGPGDWISEIEVSEL